MKFHEKLNLLMNLQSISNIRLAKALSVDPSLISRWRNGSRCLAKHSEYIPKIANYLISNHSGNENICELLDFKVGDNTELSDKLWNWLSEDIDIDSEILNTFFNKFAQAKVTKLPPYVPETSQCIPSGKQIRAQIFLGNEGKRKGVVNFLTDVINYKKTCTLKLFSDESMDWLLEDSEFYLKWAQLLTEVIRCGNKIIIIHTINRNSSALISAIELWMPLYLTGSIEPYYYPDYQESLFKKTLFIAPGISAFTSSTLADSDSREQLLYNDSIMLSRLETEFMEYLDRCRPLMKIFTTENIRSFRELYTEFENQPGDLSILSKTPSLSTMPVSSISDLTHLSSLDTAAVVEMLSNLETRHSSFEKNIAEHKQCEWIELPQLDNYQEYKFSYKGPIDWFILPKLEFSLENYIDHFKNILRLMHEHRFYHVNLMKFLIPDDIFIAVKKNVGVIICKIDHNPIYIAINHVTLIDAFQNFIETYTESTQSCTQSKTVAIHDIEIWLEEATKLMNSK